MTNDELWVKRVNRLAAEFRRNAAGDREPFAERTCKRCGKVSQTNTRIFLPEEPFECCVHPLYNPNAEGGRDGYWYAVAVSGQDPQISPGMSPSRRRYLTAECLAAGLTFGSVTDETVNDHSLQ